MIGQHIKAQYSTAQYSTVQYSTAQHGAVQYSTVQNRTEQCSKVSNNCNYTTGEKCSSADDDNITIIGVTVLYLQLLRAVASDYISSELVSYERSHAQCT